MRLRYRQSPLLLVLIIHMDINHKKVRYHLGHHISLPDVHSSPLVPSYDARYPIHDINVQIPEQQLLGPLQVPSPTSLHVHQQPHPAQSDYGLHHHGLLDLAPQHSGRHDLSTLGPSDTFSFNLSPTSIPESQFHLSHEQPPHPTSSRRTHAIAPIDTKQRPTPANSTKGIASPPSSNAAPTRPPRREASTAVIACRQWCVLS